MLGDAGVGKSRLVGEALATIDARVVPGRCLPYGEGITYWPVVEVIKQLAALPSDPVAAAAIRVAARRVRRSVEAATRSRGRSESCSRSRQPLLVVLDDLQWAEEMFLDLVESMALLSADAPLLLLCMARPELLERRSSWPAPLRLTPLSPDHADAMIGHEIRR